MANHKMSDIKKTVITAIIVMIFILAVFAGMTVYKGRSDQPDAGYPPPSSPMELPGKTNVSEEHSSTKVPVMINGKKNLFLKVITRPFSKIYDDPKGDNVKFEKVDTFRIYYAYTTPDQTPGFYEVGTDMTGNTIGFMKAEDVIEWKQYLTLKFTENKHNPTLFFRKYEDVDTLMRDNNRMDQVRDIRQKIDTKSQNIPVSEDFPVIAVEPQDYININYKPYLLPILQYKQVSFNQKETLVLKIASAVKGERKTDDISKETTPVYDHQPPENTQLLNSFKVDVVFVIDSTISMQPYIDATRRVIRQMAASISEVSEHIHFGLIAYRDDPEKAPGLEYRTKIFCNLEDGADIHTFLEKASELQEAKVPSVGFDEDVWAGIYTALFDKEKLKRRDNTPLFIVQIGDAGAHDYTGYTGFSARNIRQLAEDNAGRENRKTWVFSMHLKTPQAEKAKNIEKAEAQFRGVVSRLQGYDFYFPIEHGNTEQFENHAEIIVNTFINAFKKNINDMSEEKERQDPADLVNSQDKIEKAVKAAIQAAELEHIGTRKTINGKVIPPRDIQAWTLNRDLESPEIVNTKAMCLITRNDLDKLRECLQKILLAVQTEETTSFDFYDQLQSTLASAIREPSLMDKGTQPGNLTLGKSGILPEFIDGLPYKTELLSIPLNSLSVSDYRSWKQRIKSLIAQYEEYYINNDRWIALNDDDSPGEYVTFLEIDRLP